MGAAKFALLVLLTLSASAAVAQQHWHHNSLPVSEMPAQFAMDSAECKGYANQLAPIPPPLRIEFAAPSQDITITTPRGGVLSGTISNPQPSHIPTLIDMQEREDARARANQQQQLIFMGCMTRHNWTRLQ